MPEDLTDKITEGAQEPKSASTDAGSATGRDLRELIEADRYLASKAAASSASRGLRMIKFSHPGTV